MWRGKFSSGVSALWNEMLTTNLAETLTDLAIPAYFLHGVYDYTCSYPLAKRYSEQLKAPLKGFYTFERSAHSPIFEEPEKAGRILRDDVLAGVNNLADQAPDGPGSANR
jgi:pimeloyl-ACP methyl ester carboxylesterase